MIKKLSVTMLISISGALSANEYQTFLNTNYDTIDFDNESADLIGFSAQHFFDTKKALGPLSEFEYINTVSNVFGGFSRNLDDSENIYALSGDWIASNFILGATKQSFSSGSDYNTVRFGYLFSDNFKVEVSSSGFDNDFDQTILMSSYNHQINASDYIGVSMALSDDLDYKQISSKYFSQLENDNYVSLSLNYSKYDDNIDSSGYWGVGANYYFSPYSSILLNIDDEESVQIGGQHFFNDSFSVGIRYRTTSIDVGPGQEEDVDTLSLSAQAQF
ncbi:putative porin [Pleionea mediterranea]|uniref:Putative general porin n=1 Tax=Pleionea mediterranea TaxID=523701 RepID=A0A316FZP7_9GAMM|nr:putative porin [Pleionea mediterranea]PWK53615.1 putative general porin [Pleionea mediterranea]